MAIGNNLGKFMWNIAEQKENYSFGKPWRNNDRSLGLVIPILQDKQVRRDYKMIEETDKVHIKDTGSIDTAHVKSEDDTNVLIRSGVILAGDTQERGVVAGVVVLPHTEQDIKVKCVHASKGIRSGASFKADDVAPPSVFMALVGQDQGVVWNSVQYFANSSHMARGERTHSRIGSDNLLGTMREVEKSKETIENALKDIPVVKNQVGAIIFDQFNITGFEVFDSSSSWKALHKKVLAKYSDVLMQEQEEPLFELKEEVIPKKISEFIEEIMKSDEKQTMSNEISATYVIDGKKIVGEYTELNNNIIHVIAFKRGKN